MNLAVVARTGWRLAHRTLWCESRPRRGLLPALLTLLMMLTVGWSLSVLFHALAQARAPLVWSQRVLGWALRVHHEFHVRFLCKGNHAFEPVWRSWFCRSMSRS